MTTAEKQSGLCGKYTNVCKGFHTPLTGISYPQLPLPLVIAFSACFAG
jgi:hypothetical protein